MPHRKAAFTLLTLVASLFTATAVCARPVVSLKLVGLVVSKGADGAEKTAPLERAQPGPGQTIRYLIVASNGGSDAARSFSAVGKIPSGTAYVPGSASNATARVEFSLDGGKSWASSPTVVVHTAQGQVERNADPQTYTAVRWRASAALMPNASQTFAYAVRVK